MHFFGNSSQEYWSKLQNRLQIFQARYFFTKKQIAMVFNKTTITLCLYFTQQDLPASRRSKSCKRLKSLLKQSSTLSINPCLPLLTFHGEHSST